MRAAQVKHVLQIESQEVRWGKLAWAENLVERLRITLAKILIIFVIWHLSLRGAASFFSRREMHHNL